MIRTLTIPGEPTAKARPRVVNGHSFTPAKTKNYETLVKELYWAKHSQEKPLEGPLCFYLNAYMQIPKSVSKKRRQAMLMGDEVPMKKPDLDNIAKSVTDSLNGLAYRDDSQIVMLVVSKWWSDAPRVEISIQEWGVGV